jgi:hopanoid C-3 methylase
MKVTLIAAPAPAQFVAGVELPLGTVRTHMHKAPLTALAAWLRDDADVQVLDMQIDRKETVYGSLGMGSVELEKRRIGMTFAEAANSLWDSDVIGINANFTHSRRIISDLLQYLREEGFQQPLIVGGTDATADPEYFLRRGADLVVRGEGELVIREVLRRLERAEPLTDIPNISVMEGRETRHAPTSFLREQFDVDLMPPHALDMVALDSYIDTGEGFPPPGISAPFISIETSRGCAQACSFCATPTTKGRFRFMSLGQAAEHLDYYWECGVRTLLFQEDNLLSRVHIDHRWGSEDGRANLIGLFKLARSKGYSWEFTNGIEFGQFELNGTIDTELIETMFWREHQEARTLGCYRATLPLEDVLDDGPLLFRKLKPASVGWPVIEAIADAGIDMLTFNVIVGRPNDDLSSLRITYDRCVALRERVREHAPDTGVYFNVYLLSLLPGTQDFRRYHDLLAYDLDLDPEVVTFYLGSMKTEHFDPEGFTRARGSLSSALNDDSLIGDFDESHYLRSEEVDELLS